MANLPATRAGAPQAGPRRLGQRARARSGCPNAARAFQRTTRQSPYKVRLVSTRSAAWASTRRSRCSSSARSTRRTEIAKMLLERRGERRARGAPRRPRRSTSTPVRDARHRERGAEAQALHAGRDGPRDADPEADEPRRDRRRREGRADNGTEDESDRLPPRRITKNWRSTWYADARDMPALLKEDALLRKYLKAAPRPRGHRRRARSSASRGRSS